MHKEILTPEQQKLLPLISSFSEEFGLAGGTAIAMHIGHRESIDYDLVTTKLFDNSAINRIISSAHQITSTLVNQSGEYTIVIDSVKLTFLYYPFAINFNETFEDHIRLPNLLTLAAMKAYALGMRAKWKDYVDLYFIFDKFYSINEVIAQTELIFGSSFNQKIFRTQLAYFDDIDYSEEVIFRPGFETESSIIKNKLIEMSIK